MTILLRFATLLALLAPTAAATCCICHGCVSPQKPNTVCAILGMSGHYTCSQLDSMGRRGQISSRICNPMQDAYDTACGCNSRFAYKNPGAPRPTPAYKPSNAYKPSVTDVGYARVNTNTNWNKPATNTYRKPYPSPAYNYPKPSPRSYPATTYKRPSVSGTTMGKVTVRVGNRRLIEGCELHPCEGMYGLYTGYSMYWDNGDGTCSEQCIAFTALAHVKASYGWECGTCPTDDFMFEVIWEQPDEEVATQEQEEEKTQEATTIEDEEEVLLQRDERAHIIWQETVEEAATSEEEEEVIVEVEAVLTSEEREMVEMQP